MQNFTHTSFSLVQRLAFRGLVVAACCWCRPGAAQCFNVGLYTQADVDNFNCTTVDGDLFISGFDINNLNGLFQLTHVSGRLAIVTTQSLFTLDGLNNLTSVGGLEIVGNQSLNNLNGLNNLTSVGGLEIEGNQSLFTLNGLNNLTSVGWLQIRENQSLSTLNGLNNLTSVGELQILFNQSLFTLDGLNNLTSVGGSLGIFGNQFLFTLDGLNNLTSVGGQMAIAQNQNLNNLDELNNLTSVGGGLYIGNNQSLFTLNGLNNLTSVGGDIEISGNQNLQSLAGLDHAISGINFLYIQYNPQLLSCSVQSVCDYLGGGFTSADICCNGSGCNDRAEVEAACAVAQPVELTDFRATIPEAGRYALLTWRTASERNNLGFDIERSSDGRTWQTLALVPGHGTTQEEQSYAYTDERPQPRENYYRLKQVDFDGKFEYSDIRSVVMGSGANDEIGIYPNPAHSGLVRLDYYAEKEGDLSVSVFDALGRLMILQNQPLQAERNVLQFDFSQLTPGTYSVLLDDGASRVYRTLTIQ